ncbi:hypothetical protein A9X05_01525 [Mycobacterium sp. E3298]|nr:hypothetical protein A9X05_01525 [Mycobacterium sp. E3298]
MDAGRYSDTRLLIRIGTQENASGSGKRQSMNNGLMYVALHKQELARFADPKNRSQIACRTAAYEEARLFRAEALRRQRLRLCDRSRRIVEIVRIGQLCDVDWQQGSE